MKTYFIAILLVALLVACQPAPQIQNTDSSKVVDNLPAVPEVKADAPVENAETLIPTPSNSSQIISETKTFNVEAFQFGFEPNVIKVKVGDKVHIHLTTRDVAHSFAIKDLGVSIPTAPGIAGDGEFVVTKAGTFKWNCHTPCGSGHKTMSGSLIVE
jgi:cytochrome c oxidase subunit 2